MYKFVFDESKPSAYEGWLTKCKIGLFERWQRRFFRLQDRTLFYFKKEHGEPPCGFIPLLDVTVSDLPARKGRKFVFQINIQKPEKLGVKRAEYLINAETSDGREQWKAKIAENAGHLIVGAPFAEACTVSPKGENRNQLTPYFFGPAFHVLDTSGVKLRGIWTIDVAKEIVTRFLFNMDLNCDLNFDDSHNVAAAMLAYLRELPESLLSAEVLSQLKTSEDVTAARLREIVLATPAPQREALRAICTHFSLVLQNNSKNGVSQFSLISFLGPILIRAGDIDDKQHKSVQEKVAQVLINEAETVFADVHQLNTAREQSVIFQARITSLPQEYAQNPAVLDAPNGLIVSVVRKDELGWCTAFTSNQRVGLVHESYLVQLAEGEAGAGGAGNGAMEGAGPSIDTIRERYPHLMLIFESMIDESVKLAALLEKGK